MQDPETREQWQEAATSAAACLLLDDARLYGFITGGPAIDRDRCVDVLERAEAEHGITIVPAVAEAAALALVGVVNGA